MFKKLLEIKKFKLFISGLTLVYLLFLAFIALYPFPNQDLELCLSVGDSQMVEQAVLCWANDPGMSYDAKNLTKQNILEYGVEDWHAKEGGACELFFTVNGTAMAIDGLNIYRNGIIVEELNSAELGNYIASWEGVVSGDLAVSNTIFLEEGQAFSITMNEEFGNLLYAKSASFMQERIVGILFSTIVVIAIFIAGILYFYIKNQETMQQGIANQNDKGVVAEIIRFAMDCKKYGYYMIYSAKSDLKAEVANSYLNWFWWLLEPFCNMLVYVVVFANFMGNNIQNYAVFVFSALLMWNFFNKAVNYSVKAVRNNKEVVSKVYVPKFVILLSNMFLNLFKFLFSLIVLAGMLVFFRVSISVNILWILVIYLELFLFAFGLGMILLHYGVFIDDLSYAVSILLSMLMFLSGIFYDVNTTLVEPLNKIVLYLNPVAMLIDAMRSALIYGACPNLILLGVWFIISLALSMVGIHIVYKNENSYVKVV